MRKLFVLLYVISLSLTLNSQNLNITIDKQDVLCYGDSTGTATAIVTGGTPPYQYEWSNNSYSAEIHDLFAGTYSITVADTNGEMYDTIVQIDQPNLPLDSDITPTHVRCFGQSNGILDLDVSGGTPPYNFSWNNGEISEDILDLYPGIYSVTIYDNHECLINNSAQVLQADAPISGIIYANNVTCNGGNDGQINIDIYGGVTPYSYHWSNGSTSHYLHSATANTYYVTVTDQYNCMYIMSNEIHEPPPFDITSYDNPTICYGMETEIGIGTILGGTPPYSITWDNNDFGMTTLVDPLETTTYSAVIVDFNYCTSEMIEITVNVLPKVEIAEISPGNSLVCDGDSISVNLDIIGSAGSPYTIVCNNDTFEELPYILYPEETGWYSFTVLDNCNFLSVTDSINITVNPLPQQYSSTQMPPDGILHQGEYGQILLSSSEIGVVYYIESNSLIITEEIDGSGTSINFGENFTAGTYNIMSRKVDCGCELLQDTKIFTYENGINPNFENKIKIFPNPVTDIIFLEGFPQNSVYKIYSLNRTIIESGVIVNNRIILKDYCSGIYFLEIDCKNIGLLKHKFIVK